MESIGDEEEQRKRRMLNTGAAAVTKEALDKEGIALSAQKMK